MAHLFDPDGPRVWTLPPGRPFLADLAKAVLDAVGSTEALADALIYVPNRRSASTLARDLHTAAGSDGALILPDIRALGDLETDEAPPGTDAAFRDIGPALTQPKRLGALTLLVSRWFAARGTPMPAGACLAAARDLARLLDEATMAGGVDWSQLPGLAGNTDLATHWQQSVDFLSILTENWPDWLAEKGAVDALQRRIEAADAIAESWADAPPRGPVLIAGSTGATPASRALMNAALNAPRGAIVLPGLDRDLAEDDMALILRNAPSHPQFHLLNTLVDLRVSPSGVSELVAEDHLSPRRRLIHESLAPAELTGDWTERLDVLAGGAGKAAFAETALGGLNLIAARDETHEATLAACLMRAGLEVPDQSIALVTPDRALARRVSALLARWGVECTPSEGRPLLTTIAARRLDALLSFWQAPENPLNLANLLDQRGLQAEGDPALFERFILRGVGWWRSLDQLLTDARTKLNALHPSRRPSDGQITEIEVTASWLAKLADTRPKAETFDIAALRNGLSQLIDRTFGPEEMWQGRDGAALASVIEALSDLTSELDPLNIAAWQDLFRTLAADMFVAPDTPGHPRLAIWGPLEARLQQADRLILAGMNEDVWPARTGSDGFLPTRFRKTLGLPDPEERMGLAAHDFAGLACAPNVTLLYSQRREDAPAIASRWVWRLETLARGALGEAAARALAPVMGDDPRPWADALDQTHPAIDVKTIIPCPRPPVSARPRNLSVTRIETLIRDPYAIYAESVLKLQRLDPVGTPIDARQTGTAIHAALEDYDEAGAPGPDTLHTLFLTHLGAAGEPPESLLSRRAVLKDMAVWSADWMDQRRSRGIEARYLEVRGTVTFESPGGPFQLSAVADRIEQAGGTLSILDFKTGDPPSKAQVTSGLAPQMPLQAVIADHGGFVGVPGGLPVSELGYVAVKARPKATRLDPPDELAADAWDGMTQLIAAYDDQNQPYYSAPRPQFVKYDGDYVRLARRDEWTGEDGDD
ncbi:MAG: double-strand break repair protein AddB [Pseudomonadota bacterium]